MAGLSTQRNLANGGTDRNTHALHSVTRPQSTLAPSCSCCHL